MLDFALLHKQLNELVFDQKATRRGFSEKMAIARATLRDWAGRWSALAEKVDLSQTSWLLAGNIREPINAAHPLPSKPERLTVIATDGSQIFPDRHELSACYLINIGTVALHYGCGERPILRNRPLVFSNGQHIDDDWRDSQSMPATSDVISARRGAMELEELADVAEQAAASGKRAIVGLTDGTLILWKLAGRPPEFQDEILRSTLTSFERLKGANIPVAGYISQPASADVVNALRLALCPENPANCNKCPHKSPRAELPCEPIAGVTDAALYSAILRDSERSPVFQSQSEILPRYGIHRTYFFYLHVGAEIARIELPKWVAQTPELLYLLHAAAYDQARKGQGYPVSLAEAHEQAVIRGAEREQFYRLLENLYVREGLEVAISRKSFKKRNANI